jgi:amino acid transporter
LAKNRLGTSAVVLFVISAIAPFVVQGGIVPTALAVTGLTGVPVAFLAVAGVLGLFSVGYVAMARHVANAGAFYTYIARGLGRTFGVGAAWVALVAYNPFQIGAAAAFGAIGAPLVEQWFGVTVPWWALALAVWALVAVLGVRSIDVNGRVVAALIAAEIATIVVFSVAGLLDTNTTVTFAPLAPSNLAGPGVGALGVLALTGFAGWEQSVVFSEEVRDANRTVPRATYLSLAVIAVLYGFGSWAMITTAGSDVVARAQAEGPELLFNLAGQAFGPVAVNLGHVLLLTSLFAAMVSFHNIIARYAFALGREGVLPRAFGTTSRRTGAPKYGSLAQSALALLVLLGYAVVGWDNPMVHLFYWGGSFGAIGILLLITATSIAVPVYFTSHPGGETAWRRIVAPAVSSLMLMALTWAALAHLDVLFGVPAGSTLTRAVPALYAAATAAGIGWAFVLRRTRPAVFAAIGLGADAATAPPVPAPLPAPIPHQPSHSRTQRQKESAR